MKGKNNNTINPGKMGAVLGLGVSGAAAAELLLDKGYKVSVLDDSDTASIYARAEVLAGLGARICLGGGELPVGTQFLVVSPGISGNHRLIEEALNKAIPVRGEVELASRFVDLPLSAVTGTNGKTTTVDLLSRMLVESGRRSAPAGNFGFPLSRVALAPDNFEELVLELSSFQIERLETFHPRVAAMLNFAPDHLDRHPDRETYFRAKARLFSMLRPTDTAVIPRCMSSLLSGFIPAGVRIITWGGEGADLCLTPEGIWTGLVDPARVIIPRETLWLPGQHNLENTMAAAGIALARGASPETLSRAVGKFRGMPHRLEIVGEFDGIKYINDSKATNPHAVLAALRTLSGPVVWIAGGSEKEGDFMGIRGALGEVRKAIFIGQTAQRLTEELGDLVMMDSADSLEEAVGKARMVARKGDTVLLSPGCASFDMFKNYQDRGDKFKALIIKQHNRINREVTK